MTGRKHALPMKYTRFREVNEEWNNTTQCYSSHYGLGGSEPDPALDLAHNPMAGGRAEHKREARYYKGWLAPTLTLWYDASEECIDTMDRKWYASTSLVTCEGEGADRESTMSARLLNRLLSGGVRPQGYADPEAHLTPCELASNKVLEQKLSARFTAERSGN